MKRKICLILAVCLLLSAFSLCASAYYYEYELEAFEGYAFIKKELLVGTDEKLDMTVFEGEGPFDVFGISIIEIEDISYSGFESGYYYIKLAPEVDTLEAQKQLSESAGIKEAIFNGIEYLDYREQYYPERSPYIEMTPEELEALHSFAPDEFKVYLNHELDLAEFEGEGKHYLYGVCVEEISAIESKEASAFGYELKLGEQYMWNSDAIWVLECNENVISVEYKSSYGNGDVNSDGVIDEYDYILVKRMHFETYLPYGDELGYADVNRDGYVDEYDYILIKRAYFGTYVIG